MDGSTPASPAPPADHIRHASFAREPHGVPTLADALAMVERWYKLAQAERRDLSSALMTVAAIATPEAGTPVERRAALARIPADVGHLRSLLFARQPAAFGMKSKRFGNVLSGLRRVLHRMDLHAPLKNRADALPPEWQAVIAQVPRFRATALAGFARFCADAHVNPEAVTQITLDEYARHLDQRVLAAGHRARLRGTAQAWNACPDSIPDWPCTRLAVPGARTPYVRPPTAFPASFADDLDLFEQRMAGTVAPAGGGPRRRRTDRPATIEARRFALLQAAAALVECGRDPATIVDLGMLLEGDAPDLILGWFWQRAGNRPSAQGAQVGNALMAIARWHSPQPPDRRESLRAAVAELRPPASSGPTTKVTERVRALLQDRPLAILLALPAHLLGRAERMLPARPLDAARIARTAIALDLLLAAPMRARNLVALEPARHLVQRPGDRAFPTAIRIPAEEQKNARETCWPLGRDTARQLQDFIRRFRPHLGDPQSPFLFPGDSGGHLSTSALAASVCGEVERRTGVRVHLHLFRALAGALHLRDRPRDFETVRQLLGHSALETTMRAYAWVEQEQATRAVAATFDRHRRAGKDLARAALGGRRQPS